MTNNEHSMGAGLAAGTWWFITLSGLALLGLLMIFSEQETIESDLKQRVMESVAAEGGDWLTVEFDGRGRDALLTGAAPSAESRDLVVEMVESVYGVRVVDSQMSIKPSLSSSELSIKQQGGKVLLGGRLASQESIDAFVNSAKQTYGNDNVVNELILSAEVKTAKWLAASTGMLPTLVGMKTAHLKVSDHESQLAAEVKSHGERLVLVYQAKKLLGENLDVNVSVIEPMESGMAQKNATQTPVVADPLPGICQSKLDSAMQNRRILFASNTAELQAPSNLLLDKIITVIEECNKVVSENRLTIAGHTDSQGDDGYNLGLSQKRADAVKDYIANAVTDIGLINSVGYGESRPIESNDTDQGRTQNRRIEFKLERK